jgi:membrane fusion protein (multidrug efflux system)
MTSVIRKSLLPLIAVLALLAVIAWMAGAFRDKVEPAVLAGGQDIAKPDNAFTVEETEVMTSEPVPATIGARQATTISSRIIARITHIHVRAGDTVSQGQLLLELERSDLESRLSQAKQRVLATTARLTEARLSLERAQNLQSQGLVARAVLDEARANHDSLMAELESAQRAAEEAEVAISYTEIRSPIDGRIVDRFAEPGDTASPGERLLTLYNPLSLRIEAAVQESLALGLRLGQELEVEIPVFERTLKAQIEELVPAADPGSRSFLVKARIDYQADLMPGMYARLHIPAGTERLLLIPPTMVSDYGQLDLVWVFAGAQSERRFVRLGRSFGPDRVEVISGLQAGEVLLPQPPPDR